MQSIFDKARVRGMKRCGAPPAIALLDVRVPFYQKAQLSAVVCLRA